MLIVVTLFGIVMLAKLEHSRNALLPIVVTLLPIVTVAKLEQPSKALLSMVRTLFGIVMLARLEQPLKALGLIVVNETFVGKVTLASLEQL